ncbi:MAG: glycogen synthase [Chlamydiales bacterium]
MDILHVTSELAPIAKVGGLGDMLQGLSKAILAKGHQLEVILPKYDLLNCDQIEKFVLDITSKDMSIWKGFVESIPVRFIELNTVDSFKRGKIYGCPDDQFRFISFCHAVVEYLAQSGRQPDIIHLHDWHTAGIAGLIKERYPQLKGKIVFTIHNLAYQGLCTEEVFERLGWKDTKIKEGALYNLMKGGIVFADYITTVSPRYADEILTTKLGGNLRPVLKKNQKKFCGILNGIDNTYWNPETDPFLPVKFSLHHLEGKKTVKKILRQRLSLIEENCPLVVAITRLVPQKGLELIKTALLRTLEWGGQFILIGSPFDEKINKDFYHLKRKLAGSPHIHLELNYHEELSHLVYGGADLFLVPSIFEPCGLTQLIAMRYGTVPLVRETGGLADTVNQTNGFTFKNPKAEAIQEALDKALSLWNSNQWEELMATGMRENHSWDQPAERYLEIYQSIQSS